MLLGGRPLRGGRARIGAIAQSETAATELEHGGEGGAETASPPRVWKRHPLPLTHSHRQCHPRPHVVVVHELLSPSPLVSVPRASRSPQRLTAGARALRAAHHAREGKGHLQPSRKKRSRRAPGRGEGALTELNSSKERAPSLLLSHAASAPTATASRWALHHHRTPNLTPPQL
jgi:hypothetical protein